MKAIIIPVLAVAWLAAPPADSPEAVPEDEPAAKVWVQRGVEMALTRVLDAKTTIEGVAFDREKNTLTLSGLRVANPKGFQKGEAFDIDSIEIQAPLRQLFSPEPEIEHIAVRGADVNADTGLRGMNLQLLMKNAQSIQENPLVGRREKVWRIGKVTFEDAHMDITMPLLQPRRASLDALEMSFAGADGRGLPANEAIGQVLQRLIDEVELTTQEPADEKGAPRPGGRTLKDIISLF